jgi:hypothetical protein
MADLNVVINGAGVATFAITDCVSHPAKDRIIPNSLYLEVSIKITDAVSNSCRMS